MSSEWSRAAVCAYIAADASSTTSNAFVLNSCRIEQAALDCRLAFSAPHFMHAFAVKANPLSCVLDVVIGAGMALETASIAEFEAARRALERVNMDTSKLVFDSPVKTLQELRVALYTQCYLNVDNFQELERVAQLHAQQPVTACIGIRINPQVGSGERRLRVSHVPKLFSRLRQAASPRCRPVFQLPSSASAWTTTASSSWQRSSSTRS
jgi:diaminopimelate decarboxylase